MWWCDCCGCTWLNDNFTRANTSGTATDRLGPNWTVISGDWQITSNQLTASAPGSKIRCNLAATSSPAQWAVEVTGNIPTGAVFRIWAGEHADTSGAANRHCRWTPDGLSAGHVRVVADAEGADITNLAVPSGILASYTLCLHKNVAGDWLLSANNSGTNQVGVFTAEPIPTTFVIELLSSPSPITLTSVVASNINTTTCPGNCDSACPVFCENAQFTLAISGWTDAPAGENEDGDTFPVANCSCINGSYTFKNVDHVMPVLDGCGWVKAYPGGCPGTDGWAFGPDQPKFSLSYNPMTNQTTININGALKVVDGQLDCVNGFEAITIEVPDMLCEVAFEGGPPFTLNTVTYSLTCLGGG